MLPDDVAVLRAALVAEQLARREAEARASGAEAMVVHFKLLPACCKRKPPPTFRRGSGMVKLVPLLDEGGAGVGGRGVIRGA